MRKLPLVLIALSTLACGDEKFGPPTAPTTPAVNSVEINAPSSLAPGQSAQLIATLWLADGTSRPAGSDMPVVWFSSNSSVVEVSASGMATASQQRGEARVTARYGSGNQTRSSSREIVVLPSGTFRLIGMVHDAEGTAMPLEAAKVEVTGGAGASTLTSTAGEYRLYGVPPTAVIQISKAGYTADTQSVQLTGHGVRNFELLLSGPRLQLGGAYIVVMDMPSGCTRGPGVLPHLQRRVYEATVTQSGAVVEVVLTEPRFRIDHAGRGNRFTGFADSVGVRFSIDSYLTYYYGITQYPSVAEVLPDGTVFVPQGEAIVTGSTSLVSGGFNATFEQYGPTFPSGSLPPLLGSCTTPLTQLTLTRR